MTNYASGRRFEWKVRDALAEDGYTVIRTAGSKSPLDLVAFKVGQIVLVQCKRIMPGAIPAEARRQLLALTMGINSKHLVTPVVAYRKAPRMAIEYRRLTGPGPKDWQPWTPDQVGTP